MDGYSALKCLHIISSVVLVGVGFGSAFYLFFINRTKNVAAIAEVSRLVVRADYWFTTPAVIIQPISGIILASMAGFPLTQLWLLLTYGLFLFAGLCWLPVIWLQIAMAKMAMIAAETQEELPQAYWICAKRWTLLGTLAFPAMLVIFGLMVFKPA